MTFDDFWDIYPRKVCKKPAQLAWNAAIKRCDPLTIIAATRRYAETRKGQDPTYTCHAKTWLQQDRWTDYPAPETKAPAANIDDLNASWIIKHGYAPWIPETWVRRAIAIGLLNRETASRAGYHV